MGVRPRLCCATRYQRAAPAVNRFPNACRLGVSRPRRLFTCLDSRCHAESKTADAASGSCRVKRAIIGLLYVLICVVVWQLWQHPAVAILLLFTLLALTWLTLRGYHCSGVRADEHSLRPPLRYRERLAVLRNRITGRRGRTHGNVAALGLGLADEFHAGLHHRRNLDDSGQHPHSVCR